MLFARFTTKNLLWNKLVENLCIRKVWLGSNLLYWSIAAYNVKSINMEISNIIFKAINVYLLANLICKRKLHNSLKSISMESANKSSQALCRASCASKIRSLWSKIISQTKTPVIILTCIF